MKEKRLRLLVAAFLGLLLGLGMAGATPGGGLPGQVVGSRSNGPGGSGGSSRGSRLVLNAITTTTTTQDGEREGESENVVVVATVDGALHGVCARTGRLLWETPSDQCGGPLASATPDPLRKDREGDNDDEPILIKDRIVPEPAGDGNLFLLQNGQVSPLPFSMKQFAQSKAFVTDHGIAYSTKKVSRVLALDPITGQIVHSFGADDHLWRSNNNNDWRANVPNPIMLTRTEYILMITDTNKNEIMWNITFGEYESAASPDYLSNLGQDPSSNDGLLDNGNQYSSSTPKSLSITANVDGSVILDDLKNENAWELNFKSPALAAFSVNSIVDAQGHQVQQVFPAAPSSSHPKSLPGPHKSPPDNNVFVGLVGDSYYLLTQKNTKINGISNAPTIDAPPKRQQENKQDNENKNGNNPDNSASSPTPSETQSSDTALTIPCTPANPSYPSCLIGIHTITNPLQQKSPRPNKNRPTTTILSEPMELPSAPELDDYFHITSGWRLVEHILGFTDRTERTFVYLMTFMTLVLLTSIGYYIGSGATNSGNAVGGKSVGTATATGGRWFANGNGFGVLKIGGVAVTPTELTKQYNRLAKKFSDADMVEKKPLLPEHVDANGDAIVCAPLNSVLSGTGGKDDVEDDKKGSDDSAVEELASEEDVEKGKQKSLVVVDAGVGGKDEAPLPDVPQLNPFDVLDMIMAEAKALPALPPGEGGGKKKKKKGATSSGASGSTGAGGSTVSKVHKATAANKKKKQQQQGLSKETSVDIMSDSVSPDDDDDEILEDNMDLLMAPLSGLPPRNTSDLTVVNSTEPTTTHVVKSMPSTGSLTEGSTLRTMTVSDQILGHGSHGTMVFKGTFEGRPVAIKRLLLDFYDVAHHEVKILRDSDQHQNVIRYFYQEATERFMYIALELCPASLADVIENTTNPDLHQLRLTLKPRNVLSQIISGVQYLHSLKLVHRDIKPQNILIGESKGKLNSHPRILITDFGLCKRLADDQSSFHNTMHTSGGTIGWRAPECMVNHKPEEINSSESEHSQWVLLAPSQQMRITKSIDVFSAGCVFYYYLTGGVHPFGDKYTREINILRGNHRLDRLDGLLDGGLEAKDLIKKMIFKDPKKRPDTETILCHPYFWTPSQKLTFLQEVSDRLESEDRDPPSAILKQLERGAEKAVGKNWASKLDRRILEDLRNFRSYDTKTVQDLLRVIRNKKHHYQELSAELKGVIGVLPDGFLQYFVAKFPGLLMHVYYVVEGSKGLKKEPLFLPYFSKD
ncbi:UNVERIFIED_CONTAM: bifunctional endoribonuclease/protein kinase ire1 [Siphonaria sp. JEL0065]|nr:bifunctional endoribonuclease/protein kinase ire1 [Siphonaria sp. JEL0065]